MQVMIPNLPITLVVPTSFTNTYTCWNNSNAQVQYEPMELPNLQATSDPLSSNMTLVDRMTNECLSELNTQTSQPFMTDTMSTNSNPSIYSLSTPISTVNEKNDNNDKSNSDQLSKHQNTLFVSGLRSNVSKSDIYDHFTDCIKVIFKQYHSTPHLKYAFVVHRTHEKARRNLRRPINRSLLGSQCRVEWNTHCSDYSNNEQNIESRKIVVRGIPENVNENDLRDLFVNCHILKYCPARRIYSSTATMEAKGQNKILPG
ncbi:unnamed protein product [Adineta steineri]|uniref:RRM domain-containing protein n=1 Tax=Adineta steineri TaxID=433720 RepID=A0A819WCL3_9BILA|nr:unnamed protein product [Adineta steineri]CAF4120927.1 unnamed protein product [Adineta steineri]